MGHRRTTQQARTVHAHRVSAYYSHGQHEGTAKALSFLLRSRASWEGRTLALPERPGLFASRDERREYDFRRRISGFFQALEIDPLDADGFADPRCFVRHAAKIDEFMDYVPEGFRLDEAMRDRSPFDGDRALLSFIDDAAAAERYERSVSCVPRSESPLALPYVDLGVRIRESIERDRLTAGLSAGARAGRPYRWDLTPADRVRYLYSMEHLRRAAGELPFDPSIFATFLDDPYSVRSSTITGDGRWDEILKGAAIPRFRALASDLADYCACLTSDPRSASLEKAYRAYKEEVRSAFLKLHGGGISSSFALHDRGALMMKEYLCALEIGRRFDPVVRRMELVVVALTDYRGWPIGRMPGVDFRFPG